VDPLIQVAGGTFGVRNNQFGFNITGSANIPVVVQACTNLAVPLWVPLQAVTLTNGSFYFSESVQEETLARATIASAHHESPDQKPDHPCRTDSLLARSPGALACHHNVHLA